MTQVTPEKDGKIKSHDVRLGCVERFQGLTRRLRDVHNMGTACD
jgi:hypothetical protein